MTAVEGVVLPTRIARLPQDRRGYPVPYTATWTSDSGARVASVRKLLIPGLDFEGHITNECDLIGEGHPQFANVEPGRQLRCHEESRCGVCGELIGNRLTFVGGDTRDQGRQHYTEAPLHRECARFALAVCPGLIRARHGARLVVTQIKQAEVEYLGRFLNREADTLTVRFDNPLLGFPIPLVLVGVMASTVNYGLVCSSEEFLGG